MPAASGYATGDIEYDLGLDSSNLIKRQLRGSLIKDGDPTIGLMAFSATGAYGGGYGMIDGTSYLGLWSETGGGTQSFRVGFGTSSSIASKFTFDSLGRAVFGGGFPIASFWGSIPVASFYQIGGTNTNCEIGSWSNDIYGAGLYFYKSRNATRGSHTVVQVNDNMLYIAGGGSDGTNPIVAAEIRVDCDATPATTYVPGRITFATALNSYPVERLRIDSAGKFTFTGGTVTASTPIINWLQTWNNAAVHFVGNQITVTPTAYGANSSVINISGTSLNSIFAISINDPLNGSLPVAGIRMDGTLFGVSYSTPDETTGIWTDSGGTGNSGYFLNSISRVCWSNTSQWWNGSADVALTRGGSSTLQLGNLDSSSPLAQTFCMQSVIAGTSNTAGQDFTLQGSRGTGTGAGGKLIFKTAPAGSTGTSQNAAAERLSIDSSGNITIGGGANILSSRMEFNGASAAATQIMQSRWDSSSANSAGGLVMNKSRNNTVGSHTIVQANDNLGLVWFRGSDGVAFQDAAQIIASVDGTPGTNSMPARLAFLTTPTSAVTSVERMRISQDGGVIINQAGSSNIGNGNLLSIHSSDGSGAPGLATYRQWSNDATSPYISFMKSRGTTVGTFAAVSNNDPIGQIYFDSAISGSGTLSSASIQVAVDAAPSSGQRNAARITFWTATLNASQAERVRITSAGLFGIGKTPTTLLDVNGPIALAAPSIKTTAYTVVDADASLIFNGSASITVTLPAAGSYTGRILYMKTIAAFTVISASSNVKPRTTNTAGTAILSAAAGSWAMLQSDGTNWVIMAGA